eukprot:2398218-Rhodomonas_salina.1
MGLARVLLQTGRSAHPPSRATPPREALHHRRPLGKNPRLFLPYALMRSLANKKFDFLPLPPTSLNSTHRRHSLSKRTWIPLIVCSIIASERKRYHCSSVPAFVTCSGPRPFSCHFSWSAWINWRSVISALKYDKMLPLAFSFFWFRMRSRCSVRKRSAIPCSPNVFVRV